MLITLDEARQQLGFEDGENEDDDFVGALIEAVAQHFEGFYGIVADRRAREFGFDQFARLMVIPSTPVDRETVAITYLDGAGAEQAFADFRTAPFGRYHVRLLPAIGKAWPTPGCGDGVITVAATVGWATDEDSSEGVPADLKVAARMMLAHWYNNREAFGASLQETPAGVDALLAPYKLARV
ncbi:head-tail connector protein [Sphingomonas sp. SRS2]|uniref:head-tail connector protein n=1 Tax=Sphingomonas sp. SRS2 TaxID=133190 RepID=UPI000B0BDFF3|nr:head-tail connector protein [Sphingomonas sp. SRS2]